MKKTKTAQEDFNEALLALEWKLSAVIIDMKDTLNDLIELKEDLEDYRD